MQIGTFSYPLTPCLSMLGGRKRELLPVVYIWLRGRRERVFLPFVYIRGREQFHASQLFAVHNWGREPRPASQFMTRLLRRGDAIETPGHTRNWYVSASLSAI